MDPEQVVRGDDGIMRCRECGFPYNLSPREVVDRTVAGLEAVAAATGVTSEELRGQRPSSSRWSVNAYTCHLAQASDVILTRVKMIAEQDGPLLPYHQQDEAVEQAGGDQVPAEQSLQRLSQTVFEFRTYLEAIPAAGWKRIGRHALAGEITLGDVAHDMPHELEHHARDVEKIGNDLDG